MRLDGSLESLKKLFAQIDTDGSGCIDPVEFKHAMKEFGVILTEEEVSQILKYYDTNKDGKISFDEFLAALEGK